jgi:hypothetical protein
MVEGESKARKQENKENKIMANNNDIRNEHPAEVSEAELAQAAGGRMADGHWSTPSVGPSKCCYHPDGL